MRGSRRARKASLLEKNPHQIARPHHCAPPPKKNRRAKWESAPSRASDESQITLT